MTKREDLESEYVNLYRHAWGSNCGLDSERIRNMATSYLKQCIKSLRGFIEYTDKARKMARTKP